MEIAWKFLSIGLLVLWDLFFNSVFVIEKELIMQKGNWKYN